MEPKKLWTRWLESVALLLVAFGGLMTVAGGTVAFGFLNDRIDPAFWNDAPVPDPAADYRAWVFAVLGATMAGWGLSVFALTRHGIAKGLRWAWRAVTVSVLVWFSLDTAASLAYGVWINAMGNTVILVALAIPLAKTRSSTT